MSFYAAILEVLVHRGARGAEMTASACRPVRAGPRRICAAEVGRGAPVVQALTQPGPRLVTPGTLRYRRSVVRRIALSLVLLLAVAAPAVTPSGSCPLRRCPEAEAKRDPCTHCPPTSDVAVRTTLPDCCVIRAAPLEQPTATLQRPGGEHSVAAVLPRLVFAVAVPWAPPVVRCDSRPTGRAHLARSLPLLS